ncbi:ABC transporter substrate-binding protein [Chloroflexota bacterium]
MRKLSFLTLACILFLMPVLSVAAQGDEAVLQLLAMDQAGMTPEELDEIVDLFEEANPGVTIETNYVLYDGLHDLLVTSVSSDPPAFDIFLVDDIWFAEFADAGWVLDVTERVTEEQRAGIFEAAWPITTVNDVVYGLPWLLDQKLFYYNTELLAAAGYDAPPTTWEELVEMGQAMQEQGLVEYPMIWSWAQIEAVICDYVTLLYGNGGEFFDENNQPVFNNEIGVETLQWMVDMMNEGIVNPSSLTAGEEDVRNVFSQGNAAFATNWTYMFSLTQDPEESQVVGQVALALIPAFADVVEERASATNNGSMGFAIAAGSEHPDEAWNFIEFLTSEAIQTEYSAHQLPIWESGFADPALIEANPETVPAFAAQFPYAEVRPKVPYYNEASRLVQVAIQEALTGRATPQEALDNAVSEILEIAADYE